mmetsp:Transcript_4999/g.11689  ORF Transcript_4999/g.11689 Transcript_4999/m.11689 type:complete len:337 (-) Transcript_4999:660-1670(-)
MRPTDRLERGPRPHTDRHHRHNPKKRLPLPPSSRDPDDGRSLSSSSINSRSRPDTLVGISTLTVVKWSPRKSGMPTFGAPLPGTLMVVPGCVPGGILTGSVPSMTSTSTVLPRMASVYEMVVSEKMDVPLRVKRESGRTLTNTNRSPASPPFMPASPSPLMRSFMPSSTPAGTATSICLVLCTRPCPLHAGQGSARISPTPPQVGHVDPVDMYPTGVRCSWKTMPCPLQVGHTTGLVPGAAPVPMQTSHVSTCLSRTFSVPPNTAVAKSTSSSTFKSLPRRAARRRRPPAMPPPKNVSNMSLNPISCHPPVGCPAICCCCCCCCCSAEGGAWPVRS